MTTKIAPPDLEQMTAYLLNEDVLFVGVDPLESNLCLFININDYFIPAADSCSVTAKELPELYNLVKDKQFGGICEFVAKKRNIKNQHWRKTYAEKTLLKG